MSDFFEIINETMSGLYPVIFILIAISLVFSLLGFVRRVLFNNVSFGKSKSSDYEIQQSIPFELWEEPKKINHNRLNEYGEREYDYSRNNYECEGCK